MNTKPCPFCGSHDVKILPGSSLNFRVAECQYCGAQGPEVRIQDVPHGEHMAVLQAAAEWSYRIERGE